MVTMAAIGNAVLVYYPLLLRQYFEQRRLVDLPHRFVGFLPRTLLKLEIPLAKHQDRITTKSEGPPKPSEDQVPRVLT